GCCILSCPPLSPVICFVFLTHIVTTYIFTLSLHDALPIFQDWIRNYFEIIQPKYSAHLYSEAKENATSIKEVPPTYDANAEEVDVRVVLRDNFGAILENHPDVLIFGEDSGYIGDVNQVLDGLQQHYG